MIYSYNSNHNLLENSKEDTANNEEEIELEAGKDEIKADKVTEEQKEHEVAKATEDNEQIETMAAKVKRR